MLKLFVLPGALLLSSALPVTAAACDNTFTAIPDIQGTADSSPLQGQQLTTLGVVTAVVYPGSTAAGIVLRAVERTDSAGADSLFIADNEAAAVYQAGQLLQVSGTVAEINQLTALAQISDIKVCGETAAPAPVTLQLPLAEQQNWEQLEGALLRFEQTLTVNDTYGLGRYGEITLADTRLMTATEVMTPGKAAVALSAVQQQRHMLVLDDGTTHRFRARSLRDARHVAREFTNRLTSDRKIVSVTKVGDR